MMRDYYKTLSHEGPFFFVKRRSRNVGDVVLPVKNRDFLDRFLFNLARIASFMFGDLLLVACHKKQTLPPSRVPTTIVFLTTSLNLPPCPTMPFVAAAETRRGLDGH